MSGRNNRRHANICLNSKNRVLSMDTKLQAQSRAEQIAAFNSELEQLELEQVLTLSDQQKSTIAGYHQSLISKFVSDFDIDANQAGKQLTMGMRLASFFGALAFSASIFFLFYQYWGGFSTIAQTIVLAVSPIMGLALTRLCLEREKSGYLAKIAGLITLACFALNLSMLGQIYNITPSPNALLVCAILALGLAHKTNSRLILTCSIFLFATFLSAQIATWCGLYWLSFGERPENLLVPGALLYWYGHRSQPHFESFSTIYRLFGALFVLFPVLLLAHWSGGSYLNLSDIVVESAYQVIGFVLAAGLIGYGINKNWQESINAGMVFFTLFLYSKFFDWWWELMPKYLFFLVIALSSVLILFLFKQVRQGHNAQIQGEANA